jgi:hypothetical protein
VKACLFIFFVLSSLAAPTVAWRTSLSEVGQSGICVQGDQLYLTIHALPEAELSGGVLHSSDIIGQCFDKATGTLKWSVSLRGNNPGTVLESWHDSSSLTPVADAKRVVFHNLNGRLLACDHDGKTIWERPYAAPEPDIKQARMFIHGERLIVALPSAEIAIPPGGMQASKKKNARPLPFYQIHALDLATGETIWATPILQSHATQYSIDRWQGRAVLVTSLIDLTHWKFQRGRKGHLISLDDGKPIHSFDIPACNPHQKRQLLGDHFLIAGKSGFALIDPTSGKSQKAFPYPEPLAKFANRGLGGRRYPTHSTMHVVDGRIFYFESNRPAIGCIDASGEATVLEVPVAQHGESLVWDVAELPRDGAIANSAGRVVLRRAASLLRGPQWGGFGHVNPAYPLRFRDHLYWQGGLGMLYRIDLRGDFSSNRLSWMSISEEGGRWCFGEPAVDADGIYLRSQIELVRITWE